MPESCTNYRSEAQKALFSRRSWNDFDPQVYCLYGEDQNHETSLKDKALQAAVDSWCKIQVIFSSANIGRHQCCQAYMNFVPLQVSRFRPLIQFRGPKNFRLNSLIRLEIAMAIAYYYDAEVPGANHVRFPENHRE